MDIDVKPGRYVVAVSGGVDSMVLLDLLAKKPGVKLTVAHFDHGMRHGSKLDRVLVQTVAKKHGLPFVYDEGELGSKTSEAAARQARYDFLRGVQNTTNAHAIITAHHQDDVLETAIINILRGTGRSGLSALKSTHSIVRPLLHLSKADMHAYAKANGLSWREDPSNQDTAYLRNYIRHKILPRFSEQDKQQFLKHITRIAELNQEIDTALITHLHIQPAHDVLDKHRFIMLPHSVALEVLAAWLREHGVRNFDKKLLEKLAVAAKTLHSGKQVDVDKTHHIKVGEESLALVVRTNT